MPSEQNSSQKRRLDVAGTTNFRDLGGYATADGSKRTKWGLLFRCDVPLHVDEETAKTVLCEKLHIHNVFDLRKEGELKDKPYDLAGIQHHYVSSDSSMLSDWSAAGKAFTAEITFALMVNNYYDRADNHTKPYETIFRFIIDEVCAKELARVGGGDVAREAVLFHCTAGKDRTGWMAALLLHVLGVPRGTIVEDFMLTNKYLVRPKDAKNYLGGLGMDEASMNMLWTVDERYLTLGLEYVERKYGSIDAYVRDKLHLSDKDIETLRAALLE